LHDTVLIYLVSVGFTNEFASPADFGYAEILKDAKEVLRMRKVRQRKTLLAKQAER